MNSKRPAFQDTIYSDIPRLATDSLRQLGGLSVATLAESQGRTGLMDPAICSLSCGLSMYGQAVTCECEFGDNLTLQRAVALCKEGDVVVAVMRQSRSHALWGELIARAAVAQKVSGAVVDGPARDVKELRNLRFPVWARGAHPRGSDKGKVASVNVPVVCGGVLVKPGDVVVADDDGVIVVQWGELAAVVRTARRRAEREDEVRSALGEGATLSTALGLDALIRESMSREVPGIWREDQVGG